MTEWLSVDDVIAIHDSLETAPVIDRGKLAAAVIRPQASFGAALLHPSVYSQAAVFLHGICQAHAFLDGNKRTAWVCALTFLSRNGIEIQMIPAEAMSDYMVEVATGIHTPQDVALLFAQLTV